MVPALHDAVDRLSPPVRHIAGYHLGWWDADGIEADASGGKGIRPALTLLCTEAVGAAPETAIPAAVAVELIHNFSLLHDDVMDRDESRRHRLTAWRVFGIGGAILAGDAMLALAVEVLAGGEEMVRTLCASVEALIDGQIADISFEARTDVSLAECVQMARNKTGALLSAACILGAQAGGGNAAQIDGLTRFGAELGLAFQVADDLQGIWGDPDVTGKADYSDLRNRKKSLPVVAALESVTAAGTELHTWFVSAGEPSALDVERVAALVEEGGGRDWALRQLASLHAEALEHLNRAQPTARAGAELAALSALVAASASRATR